MSAALALVNPSLHERVSDVELLATTLAAMDDANLTEDDRAFFEAEITEAIAGTREKVDRTASLLACLEADEALAAREIERLTARIAHKERQRLRLEAYVIRTLMESGLQKFDGFTSTLAFQHNPPSVVLDPNAKLPAAFMRTPTPKPPVPAPDKALIKAALGRGEVVPGCRMVSTTRLVRS